MASDQNEPTGPAASSRVEIDRGKPLSRSLLWDIQRRYFEDQGIEAWRTNIVPSYITSNPYIALSYARVVLGYLRDCYSSLDSSQPVYIVELGAGGGRFAFHFMRSFLALLAQSPFPDLNFCYVLTDLPDRNLDFWQDHADFQEWASAGRMDFARFDAHEDQEIHLRRSGQSICSGHLKNPLVLLANYFFDSLPQDAFHVENGVLQECQIRLTSTQEEPDPTATDVLPRLMIHFLTKEGDNTAYYQDPDLDDVLEEYRVLENSYLLFCADAIRLLRRMIRLADRRLMAICGDYGPGTVKEWDHNGSPDIRIHGAISMEVNFSALGAFIKNQGGRFFAPGFRSHYLTVCAFATGEAAGSYREMGLAYAEAIERAGPNDFFLVKRGMEKNYPDMSVEEILAFLRISGWDAHLFLDIFANLLERLPSASPSDQEELVHAMYQLWNNYYHIGEERDLPFSLGVILFRLERPDEALGFFERSLEYYGASQMTLYNIALCLVEQGKDGLAMERVRQALEIDPQFEPALLLEQELAKSQS